MKGRLAAVAATAALVGLCAGPALGSGGPEPTPLFIDVDGGSPVELGRLYAGRLTLVTARSPAPLLYLDWRLLHGLAVGDEAGAALSVKCCDPPGSGEHEGVYGWLEARAIVPGVPESPYYLPTELAGPDYTSIPNCFRDAFDTAAATLRDRAARFGRKSAAVRSWLLTQDKVFEACASDSVALPPAMAGAPAWLRADRAYQEAAFALYNRRNVEAAERFGAIARDLSSPWRGKGLYLRARAIQREALARGGAEPFARSRAALAELAAAPPDTYGQGEARKMLRALDYRDRPGPLLAQLDRELARKRPIEDIGIALRDYLTLSEEAAVRPEAADWIMTLHSRERVPALDHARERWAATRDVAWLVAALSLVNPGDAAAAQLVADARAVEPDHVAWGTAQYHLTRLTLADSDPAVMRARLDRILARPLLTLTERNLFTAARAQVAADLGELARFSLRRPYCDAAGDYCVQDGWAGGDRTLGRGPRPGEWLGLGAEAQAIADRLPLDERIALARSPLLPAELRLDLALTGFARAVQLQDNRAIDGLAGDLRRLLPQLRSDWAAIRTARPGPAKRFAEFFVMARLPGLRTDFPGYTRPQGTVPQWQGNWVDWAILPRGSAPAGAEPPGPRDYAGDEYWYSGDEDDGEPDLTCLGRCGLGTLPLHVPPFVAAMQGEATAERAYFASMWVPEGSKPLPAGALSVWDELLAYARAHPRDPRSPESLYWLIHVARWGPNHDHMGRRAFQLLHARYPKSAWAKKSPYYYD